MRDEMKAFLAQNTDCASSLSGKDRKRADSFAEHHAGGLVDLANDLGDGWNVKMHDDWGDTEGIVVHTYNADADNPEATESVRYFNANDGHEALEAFLSAKAPRSYVVGLPVGIIVHDDGRVTYWIDTAEAGSAIGDGDNDVDDATERADVERVEADHAARGGALFVQGSQD